MPFSEVLRQPKGLFASYSNTGNDILPAIFVGEIKHFQVGRKIEPLFLEPTWVDFLVGVRHVTGTWRALVSASAVGDVEDRA